MVALRALAALKALVVLVALAALIALVVLISCRILFIFTLATLQDTLIHLSILLQHNW